MYANKLSSLINMRSLIPSLVLLALLNSVRADLHQMIVGTFGTDSLYTLEFDDEALTLEMIANTTTPASSSWIALSVQHILGNFVDESLTGFSTTRRTSMATSITRLLPGSSDIP